MADYKPQRLGAEWPDSTVRVRTAAEASLAAACGIPIPLTLGTTDGTAMREGFRRFLHATISPLGRLIEAEARIKLAAPSLALTFAELGAGDTATKARGVGQLVKAGASLEDALETMGLA